jgi:EAL and modified HD-GYP domain-containing signal transduction protein
MVDTTEEVLLARQPICSRRNRTLGYELLFRKPGCRTANIEDADSATRQVIVNSFVEIGLERVVGTALAFINVSRDFIVSDQCRSLPPGRVVFEILENTVPDPELTDALLWLRKAGYRFALDDYDFSAQTQPLVPFCDFVKVDLQRVDRSSLADNVSSLNEVGLVAEKVETQEEYDFCKRMGFDYFQGYYFCEPRIISGSRIPTNSLTLLRLLAKLRDPNVSTKELEQIISHDISLSYKLLQYLNSAYMGMKTRIESIGHAVRLAGTEHLRFLATLLMMTSMDDKPRALAVVSLIRAKMCELVAKRLGIPNTEPYFTVGLFSTLDAFLDCTMDEALDNLPLSDQIRKALVRREGELGQVLRCVLTFDRPGSESDPLGLDASALQNAYTDSICWSEKLLNGVSA